MVLPIQDRSLLTLVTGNDSVFLNERIKQQIFCKILKYFLRWLTFSRKWRYSNG